MKNIQGRALVFILWIFIAMIPLSCGTRKTATKIEKNAEIVQEKQESKGQVKKVEEKKEVVNESEKTKDVQDNSTIVVTELFSADGLIQTRVKEIKVDRTAKNTSNIKSSVKTYHIYTDSIFNNTNYRLVEVTKYVKDKTTTRKNDGWYWVVGIVGVIGLAFWLKPWMK